MKFWGGLLCSNPSSKHTFCSSWWTSRQKPVKTAALPHGDSILCMPTPPPTHFAAAAQPKGGVVGSPQGGPVMLRGGNKRRWGARCPFGWDSGALTAAVLPGQEWKACNLWTRCRGHDGTAADAALTQMLTYSFLKTLWWSKTSSIRKNGPNPAEEEVSTLAGAPLG